MKKRTKKIEKTQSGKIVVHLNVSDVKMRNEVHLHHIMTTHAHVIESKKHKGEKHRKDYRRENYD